MKWFAIVVVAFLLAACGGGGGGGPSDTPLPPADYSANAAAAKLTSTVTLAPNLATLSWTDTFPSGASYRIESRNQDSSYSLVDTVTGLGGTSSAMQWQRAITASTVYRVVAVLNNAGVTLLTPQGQSTVSAGLPTMPPTIVVDKVEPVTGTVQLSLSDAVTTPSVSWYADQLLIGSGTGVGNPVSWNTNGVTDGSHLILARVQVATDSYIEVRRFIAVSNSGIAIHAVVVGTTGTINVNVTATSSSGSGINSVSATLDGASLGSLSAPNACSTSAGCGSGNDRYRFTVSPVSGDHTMVVTVTDKAGTSHSTTVQVPVSNLPGLTLTSPAAGAFFVSGTLILSGSSSTDRPGGVTVVASLGDYQFMSSTNPSFSGSMNLAGLSAGSHTLTVTATDSANASTVIKRGVIVASSPSVAYAPLFTIEHGEILAVEGDLVLYRANSIVRLRNVVTGSETIPNYASYVGGARDWQISNGYIYASGTLGGCAAYCIFQWAPDGSDKNLSNSNPYSVSPSSVFGMTTDMAPVAHDGYVIWHNCCIDSNRYTLYDVAKGTYTKIAAPAGPSSVGRWNYDFTVQNGVISFYYWAQTGRARDIFKWTSDTQISTRLTDGVSQNVYPQTDGQRVAWFLPANGADDRLYYPGYILGAGALMTLPVAGGSATTASTATSQLFLLRDGVLAWLEPTSSTSSSLTGTLLKASAQGITSIISTNATYPLMGAGGGHVVFGELGKTYSWNAITRSSTVRIDAQPRVVVNGRYVYFEWGGTVYRMVLD